MKLTALASILVIAAIGGQPRKLAQASLWKSVRRFELEAPPITSIMDQKPGPLDRASFKRTIHYHDAIYSKAKLD